MDRDCVNNIKEREGVRWADDASKTSDIKQKTGLYENLQKF
jgi:hypothetical protein